MGKVFSYYRRLNRTQQRIYRQSDEIAAVPLSGPESFRPLITGMEQALGQDNRRQTETLCQRLVSNLTARLRVPPVRVAVLAARPSNQWGELHGLYTPEQESGRARITVWMRTAQRRQVVAFRTFLRTLLHELCHHLDYELFNLADSFHTEGFYKRESSLLYQLVGKAAFAKTVAADHGNEK